MSNNHPSQEARIKSVLLDDAKLSEMLDRLDQAAERYTGEARRTHERYTYRLKGLVVNLQQPGGNDAAFLVPTRNISGKGLCFLHGGFVHTGTRCRVQLLTTHNTWQEINGTVVRCRHVEGRIHEIGIRFDGKIDVAVFSRQAVRRRLLVVDDDPSSRRLIAFLLGQIGAEVVMANNGQEAVEKAMTGLYDCVLMDVTMPVLDGFEAVAQLRDRGYTGMVVALTALTRPEDRQRCLEAGFNEYLAKPIKREALINLLETMAQDPLFSSLTDEPGMAELVNQFVADLPLTCQTIQDAMARGSLEEIERLSRDLKGDAGGYGFEPITDLAKKVEEAARSGGDMKSLQEQVEELCALCAMARPTDMVAETQTMENQKEAGDQAGEQPKENVQK